MLSLEMLTKEYRKSIDRFFAPLVLANDPALMDHTAEYRKMVELSTKVTLAGHACTEIAGYPFDERRRVMSALFGACCFLGDSFVDDFGEVAAQEYLARLETLLTEGWFDVRNDREQLFYVAATRLCAERDILRPLLRQAILRLFLTQKTDVELRSQVTMAPKPLSRSRLNLLKRVARDKSGHVLTLLTLFLVPDLPLGYCALIFKAGATIQFIDDYGDYHADRFHQRVTYINQLRDPRRSLARMYGKNMRQLHIGLPENGGRDLMEAFITRYFTTRIKKHELERGKAASWAVYE